MYIGVAWWGYCECIGHEHITPQELREFPVVVRPEFRTFLLGVNSPVFGLLGSLCCCLDTFLVLARTKHHDRRFSKYKLGFRRVGFASIAQLINCSQQLQNN
jgi:hypothetical protein